VPGESPIGAIEAGAHGREVQAQVGEHVRVLRPFAGEQEGDLALPSQRLGEVVDAAAVLDAAAVGRAQPRGGMLQLLAEVVDRRGDDGQPLRKSAQAAIERSGEIGRSGVAQVRQRRAQALRLLDEVGPGARLQEEGLGLPGGARRRQRLIRHRDAPRE
jgi:hypothetical protein